MQLYVQKGEFTLCTPHYFPVGGAQERTKATIDLEHARAGALSTATGLTIRQGRVYFLQGFRKSLIHLPIVKDLLEKST